MLDQDDTGAVSLLPAGAPVSWSTAHTLVAEQWGALPAQMFPAWLSGYGQPHPFLLDPGDCAVVSTWSAWVESAPVPDPFSLGSVPLAVKGEERDLYPRSGRRARDALLRLLAAATHPIPGIRAAPAGSLNWLEWEDWVRRGARTGVSAWISQTLRTMKNMAATDPDPSVRLAWVSNSDRWQHPRDGILAERDPDLRVRLAAASTLPGLEECAVALLTDPDPRIRVAILSNARTRVPAAEVLDAVRVDRGNSVTVRLAAARRDLSDEAAVHRARVALLDPDPSVRLAVLDDKDLRLCALPGAVLAQAVATADTDVRQRIAAHRLAPVTVLLMLRTDPDQATRNKAASNYRRLLRAHQAKPDTANGRLAPTTDVPDEVFATAATIAETLTSSDEAMVDRAGASPDPWLRLAGLLHPVHRARLVRTLAADPDPMVAKEARTVFLRLLRDR